MAGIRSLPGDKTKCLEDAKILKDFIEQDKVYDFLVGLNP